MALENPNFLEDLNEANPHGDLDELAEGDDHIRNFKRAVRSTFPGMAGRAWRRVSRSASGSLVRTDNMTLQNASLGITLSPDNANVLGNGWMALVRAPSGGSIIISADEKINGSDADYVVPAGHICMLLSDGSEFFAVIMYGSTPANTPSFPAGTKMMFVQTTAPSGWTKLTNSQYNDSALRMTTGTVGIGGADSFTAHFGPGKATAGHTLTNAQSPAHTHRQTLATDSGGGQKREDPLFGTGEEDSSNFTRSSGGGGSHMHDLNNFDIKFVDVIVAEKN